MELLGATHSSSLKVSVVKVGQKRELHILAELPQDLSGFEGVTHSHADGTLLVCSLNSINARAIRDHLPWLKPMPLGLQLSAGVGDRLGLATPGHARAFRKYGQGIAPVFAQQSAREMHRLDRSPQDVMDATTFGLIEADWEGQHGSDADHLKTSQDIDSCLAAGFTSFTLDPGEYVHNVPSTFNGNLDHLPWNALEDDESSLISRYANKEFELADSSMRITEDELRQAAYKYGPAIAYTVSQYRHLMERASHPIEVEVAVDETDEVTTLGEHIFMVTEMRRLGMNWVSFAPRYLDGFEKGIEFKGNLESFGESLRDHASIAAQFGPYKLSLHSGSDKFKIYAMATEATNGLLHLKTSGTSYLEALAVAAVHAPALFREIYEISRTAYEAARSTYQVSAQLQETPLSSDVSDENLSELVTQPDARQILHVGYGAVLALRNEKGEFGLRQELESLLLNEKPHYDQTLESHIGKHLSLLRGAS